ncbi:MAG: hypothetical protein H6718_00780 [Polyangiaceae bacterium]|nr:hypothetical protein [Polyangiaceae bacterium]MCB9607846.1 hypothetical protein [Polyangiaceae bacterium]
MKHRLVSVPSATGPLLLLISLLACKQTPAAGDPAAGDPPAASATTAAAPSGTFPSYPATKSGGVLWLKSEGGPLGEQVYSASPTEVSSAEYYYSQSLFQGKTGEQITYTLKLQDLARGEHDLEEGKIHFYTGTGSDGTYRFSGRIRIDENDPKRGALKCVFAGNARNEDTGKVSKVEAAVVLLPK